MDKRFVLITLALAMALIHSKVNMVASFRTTTESATEDGQLVKEEHAPVDKDNKLAANRAACIKEVATELKALDKSYILPDAQVLQRLDEARRYYEVEGEIPLGPEELASCVELRQQFQAVLDGQGECFRGINPLSPKWIVPSTLQAADQQTKLRFEALYACEWGRFTGPAMNPGVYGAIVGAQVEQTDKKVESHNAEEPSNGDHQSRTSECFEKVLPLIKSEIPIDDSSLMERVEEAREYYSTAEDDIPDYGGEPLDGCARLKVQIDEVLILADCFQDSNLMGSSVPVNFKEIAGVDGDDGRASRHVLETFYACQEGRYAGHKLRDLGLFDAITAPTSGSDAARS